MHRHFEHRRPLGRGSSAKDGLARFQESRVIGDEGHHQQHVDQILEAFVPLAPSRGQRHSVQLLSDVHPQRKTGQFCRPVYPGGLAKQNGRRQLDIALARFGAAAAWDEQGEPLLDRNPLKGMPRPKDDEPRRPLLGDEQYEAMLRVSRKVSPLFDLALVRARETGHRLGAVISLRWSDIDVERGVVHWRGQNDKIGFDHETPLTPAAIAVLQRARAERPSIGDAWVFPAASDSTRRSSRHLFRQWWRQAERLGGITHEAGLGWHSLRRAFATALKHAPLKDLCELGGWKNAQTILKAYQRADHATMRQARATRQRTVGARPA
jgi:integrase